MISLRDSTEGAAFALGMSAAEGADVARQFAAQGNPFGDYALPAVALTRVGAGTV